MTSDDAADKCNGQGTPRVADFPGDLACLPPATEAEEGAHDTAGDRRKEGARARAAYGEGQQIRNMGMTGNNRPANQREQDDELEAVDEGHDRGAEARADEINEAEDANEQCRNRSQPARAPYSWAT